jgi:hypothetical protein
VCWQGCEGERASDVRECARGWDEDEGRGISDGRKGLARVKVCVCVTVWVNEGEDEGMGKDEGMGRTRNRQG